MNWRKWKYVRRAMTDNIWEQIVTSKLSISTEIAQPKTNKSVIPDECLSAFAPMFLDTETSGMILRRMPMNHVCQPDIIQIAMILDHADGYFSRSMIVNPSDINSDWELDPQAEAVHGISKEQILDEGIPSRAMLEEVKYILSRSSVMACHNWGFDSQMLAIAFNRAGDTKSAMKILNGKRYCTMIASTNLCRLPGKFGNYKWPKLEELHQFLFMESVQGAHDALNDTIAIRRCYHEMRRMGI